MLRQILVQQLGTAVDYLCRLPVMAQLSTLLSHAVAAIAKATRADRSMFENPFYIKSLHEPSQYFMLYLYAEMLHISFTQLIVSPTAFLCRLERQLQCPCRSCCGDFELVVPGRNDASAGKGPPECFLSKKLTRMIHHCNSLTA